MGGGGARESDATAVGRQAFDFLWRGRCCCMRRQRHWGFCYGRRPVSIIRFRDGRGSRSRPVDNAFHHFILIVQILAHRLAPITMTRISRERSSHEPKDRSTARPHRSDRSISTYQLLDNVENHLDNPTIRTCQIEDRAGYSGHRSRSRRPADRDPGNRRRRCSVQDCTLVPDVPFRSTQGPVASSNFPEPSDPAELILCTYSTNSSAMICLRARLLRGFSRRCSCRLRSCVWRP
ncbi:hypothetical protein GW17_00025832 [Ensete ventricosum]|nr:hypothetical protein GW17_00025832 [Ensete ventricosum]